MKAIATKYLGPTNTKGSRIKAYEPDGQSITLSWDHSLDAKPNHVKAAKALLDKLDWGTYNPETGALKNEYVHVLVKEGKS